MTSSLVGSEMCIRDREPTRLGATRGHTLVHAEGRGDCGLYGVVAARPVSYTHLTLPTICSV
eukprot:4259419-Prorocentrum_lima.AAC.1